MKVEMIYLSQEDVIRCGGMSMDKAIPILPASWNCLTMIPASIIPCMMLWRQTGSVQKVCPHGCREIMQFYL